MVPRLFVVCRHGQSEDNFAWRLARDGDTSVFEEYLARPNSRAELTDTGRHQIEVLGNWLREQAYEFDRLYRSPLVRARQSSQLLKLPGEWSESEYLREQRLGIMESMLPDEREVYLREERNQAHLDDPYNFAPEGGESFGDILRDGAMPYLEMLDRQCNGTERVLVMAHSGINKMLDCAIRGWTPEEFVEHYVHGDNKIFNGMALVYTRINPWTGEESATFDWVQTCCPWSDPEPSPWHVIERKSLLNWSLARLREIFSIKPAA